MRLPEMEEGGRAKDLGRETQSNEKEKQEQEQDVSGGRVDVKVGLDRAGNGFSNGFCGPLYVLGVL